MIQSTGFLQKSSARVNDMSKWLDHVKTVFAESAGYVFEVDTEAQVSYPKLWQSSTKWLERFFDYDQKMVAVILPNSICYLEVYLGVLRSRNIFSPLPYFVSLGELERILEYENPVAVITDRKDIIEKFSGSYEIIVPSNDSVLTKDSREKTISDSDIACLYYSSGTTGNQKGVLYSHDNIYHLIKSICSGFRFTSKTKQLAFLPFGHTASINYNIFPAFFCGSPLYVSKGFEEIRDRFFSIIAKYKINYTETVPTVLFMLLKLKQDISGLDLSSLPYLGCGSSTLPIETQNAFYKTYGLKVANLYGLSETGPSHFDDPTEPGWEPGSIGRTLDVNQCKISNDGEILLKGKAVFVGYFQNEKLYKEVVQDGWFATGDLGHEKDGKFYFDDRKKDLIIKSGINILPSEVEEIIYKCEDVKECVVFGKVDSIHGETVAAAVVPKSDIPSDVLTIRIKQVCKQHLSNYKIPSIIHVISEIPKTHSGKLLRKKIREQYGR